MPIVKAVDTAGTEVEEIDGGLEVVAAMGKIVVIQEVEVEVTAESIMAVVIVEVTVEVIREVVALLAIVQKLSVRATGAAKDDLPRVVKDQTIAYDS